MIWARPIGSRSPLHGSVVQRGLLVGRPRRLPPVRASDRPAATAVRPHVYQAEPGMPLGTGLPTGRFGDLTEQNQKFLHNQEFVITCGGSPRNDATSTAAGKVPDDLEACHQLIRERLRSLATRHGPRRPCLQADDHKCGREAARPPRHRPRDRRNRSLVEGDGAHHGTRAWQLIHRPAGLRRPRRPTPVRGSDPARALPMS